MGCQKWLCLCAPIFLTYLWWSRWCDLCHHIIETQNFFFVSSLHFRLKRWGGMVGTQLIWLLITMASRKEGFGPRLMHTTVCQYLSLTKGINYLKCRKGFDHSETAYEFDIDRQPRLFQFPLWLVHYHLLEHRQSPWKNE